MIWTMQTWYQYECGAMNIYAQDPALYACVQSSGCGCDDDFGKTRQWKANIVKILKRPNDVEHASLSHSAYGYRSKTVVDWIMLAQDGRKWFWRRTAKERMFQPYTMSEMGKHAMNDCKNTMGICLKSVNCGWKGYASQHGNLCQWKPDLDFGKKISESLPKLGRQP